MSSYVSVNSWVTTLNKNKNTTIYKAP